MDPRSELALIFIELGLLMALAVASRTILRHQLSTDEIPLVLRHRIDVIDRVHSILWATAAVMCGTGLVLFLLP